jgi:transcriptional regulator with XRE-family HTH domain
MATPWREIKHKFSAEEHEQIKREALAELDRIGFNKLRQARKQTQVALAERLDIPQNAVSRMERRTDLLLSTMRGFVEALGGKLELRVIFPDGEFVLEELAPPPRAKSRKRHPKPAADEAASQLVAP